METNIKVKSVTSSWISKVLLSVIIIVCIVEIAMGFFTYSYFCNEAIADADDYARYFSGLSYVPAEKFNTAAREYIETFTHADIMQVQILDATGQVVADTTGLATVSEEMPDYDLALTSDNKTGWNVGKSDTGEAVMSQCFLLNDTGYGANGAVRWVISMSPIYLRLLIVMVVALLIGGALIFVTTISGRYFAQSVVRPVREVTKTARQIATGDFKQRLEVTKSDEIGELCDTINYMASELSAAEDMKNDFISSVSHELRTPLTAIKGWGETAKSAIGSDDELLEKGITVILSEAERLQGLVEELLDFSRMQSGKLSFNMSETDIAGIIDESAYMYDELARSNNIALTVVRPKELPPVLGDLNRLKQVFINIIDNAVKYTVKDGSVRITTRVEEGFIRTVISDTGVGIPEQDIDRVKEKFFKSNKTIRGSGIGLAVADEIIKQHNGLLFLESRENVGTTVTVVLPVARHEDKERID